MADIEGLEDLGDTETSLVPHLVAEEGPIAVQSALLVQVVKCSTPYNYGNDDAAVDQIVVGPHLRDALLSSSIEAFSEACSETASGYVERVEDGRVRAVTDIAPLALQMAFQGKPVLAAQIGIPSRIRVPFGSGWIDGTARKHSFPTAWTVPLQSVENGEAGDTALLSLQLLPAPLSCVQKGDSYLCLKPFSLPALTNVNSIQKGQFLNLDPAGNWSHVVEKGSCTIPSVFSRQIKADVSVGSPAGPAAEVPPLACALAKASAEVQEPAAKKRRHNKDEGKTNATKAAS